MKYLALLIQVLLVQPSFASFRSFESLRDRTTKDPVISKRLFQSTVENMGDEFQYLAKIQNEQLLTYAGWNDPTADQAMARRWDTAQVLIFRGMAHRTEINRDALALIVCHELGHLYGGTPLKEMGNYISAEGQADYFATNICLKRALSLLDSDNVEQRSLKAIEAVGAFLANNWGHEHPSESTPDASRVDQTLLDHPTPQCRFDTYLAGLYGKKRPNCWFADK